MMTEARLQFWGRLALPVLVVVASTCAQPDTAWTLTYPSTASGYYQPLTSLLDATGSLYVVGWAQQDSNSFGSLLMKVSALGQLSWARTYNGLTATGAAMDTSGNVYIAGGYGGTSANGKICVMKYNPSGDTEWVRTYEEVGKDYRALGSIAIDSRQNVYACGAAESSSCFPVRIVKYLPNGMQAGVISYTLNQDMRLCDGQFHVLANGDAYLALGAEHPQRRQDWLIVRLSSASQVLWQKVFRDSGDKWEQPRSSEVDENGSLYLTGNAYSTTTGAVDFCTMKIDSSSSILWTREYHSSDPVDVPRHLLLSNGNVYVAGGGFDRIVLIKYDSLGNEQWVRRYGAADTSGRMGYGYDGLSVDPGFRPMATDDSGNVYLTGLGHQSSGYYGLLLKYDADGNRIWVKKQVHEQGVKRTGATVNLGPNGELYDIGIDAGPGIEGTLYIYVVKYGGR